MLHLLGLFGVVAAATQVALNYRDEWNLDTPPQQDGTGNFVFNTVASLLQQWPNARYRSGHTYVPATMAPGTLLYHGRKDSSIPAAPDWLATDPEHSFIFCEPWHLTFVTTRPIKLLYLDGSSAAKMNDGSLDTQDLLIWGRVHDDPTPFEYELARIRGLCEWGKEFGLDGFVRMEMDFEIMFCNFSDGLELVSSQKLTSCVDESTEDVPLRPSSSRGERDFGALPAVPGLHRHGGFHIVQSGAYHNDFPGETRIKPLPHQLVTYYDTSLVPSLASLRRQTLTRWEHRAGNASTEDIAHVKRALEQTLRDGEPGSGVDWISLVRVIIHRYAERLELLDHTLRKEQFASLKSVKEQVRVLLGPHTGVGANASEVYKHCATSHTAFIMNKAQGLTASEKLVLGAVRDTQREICRVLVKIWFEIDQPMFNKWHSDVRELMNWLDWSIWVRCEPACGYDETCYIPTWPWLLETEREAYHPQPQCIKRLPPYTF